MNTVVFAEVLTLNIRININVWDGNEIANLKTIPPISKQIAAPVVKMTNLKSKATEVRKTSVNMAKKVEYAHVAAKNASDLKNKKDTKKKDCTIF